VRHLEGTQNYCWEMNLKILREIELAGFLLPEDLAEATVERFLLNHINIQSKRSY
jgi:hypothetical protein